MDGPEEAAGGSAALGANVTRLIHEGRELFLVGTAHVSRKSVDEVRHVIKLLEPDTVCVELDAARLSALKDDKNWHGLSPRGILRPYRAGLFLSSLVFAGFQKRLGDRLGARPGMEMLAAVEAAEDVGATVVLADREIQATLMRCYRSLGPIDRAKVLFILFMLPFTASEIDEAEVEKLKDREKMGDVMEAFAREMPALGTPLIDERDRYLMASVQTAPGKRVVAVVGAAHVPGMTRHLGTPADRAALSVIPSRSARSVVVDWLPAAAIVAMVGWTFARAPSRVAKLALMIATPSVALTVIVAGIAGAGVLAALAGGLLAPLTLLFPVIRVGPVTGFIELARVTPTPSDALRLRDDVLSPSRARKNAFLRPLLVAVGASFGRSLGGAIGLGWAIAWLLFG
jgi:pheromone shutdown-related protein TraB